MVELSGTDFKTCLRVQIILNENDIADVQAEYEGPGMNQSTIESRWLI